LIFAAQEKNMSLGIDFGAFGATNPFTGNTPFTAIDPFNAALENNGASQPLGSLYFLPINAAGVPIAPATTVPGQGLQLALKYVRYNPTTSQTIQAGPALVYWKDETFTTVTPLFSEAFLPALQSSGVAGWLGYNTTTLPSATAASINGNFAWIVVGGFISGAFVTAATAGQGLYGVATGAAWATTTTAPAPARLAGIATTAAAGGLADIYVPLLN
jgi:hypothetical protein